MKPKSFQRTIFRRHNIFPIIFTLLFLALLTSSVAINEQRKVYTSQAVERNAPLVFDETDSVESGFIRNKTDEISVFATAALTINMKLKFQGITTRPPGVQTSLPVKITLSNDMSQTVNFTVDQNGVWSGIASFDAAPTDSALSVFVKGPFHIQKKICEPIPTETRPGIYACKIASITLKKGENDTDFSKILLLAGDLPPQDGVVDASDIAFVRQNIGSSDPKIIEKGDLNLDGAITTQDYSLILAALSVKTDDQIIGGPSGSTPTVAPTTKPASPTKTPSNGNKSSSPKSPPPPPSGKTAPKSPPPSAKTPPPPAGKAPPPPAGKGACTLIPGSSNITNCCAGNTDLGLVNPDLASRTQALLNAAHAAGVNLYVWSAFRTRENQAQCVIDTGGQGSAAPGTSMHEKGLAVDVDGDLNWAHANAGNFGLGFPISWDKWHMQMQ